MQILETSVEGKEVPEVRSTGRWKPAGMMGSRWGLGGAEIP